MDFASLIFFSEVVSHSHRSLQLLRVIHQLNFVQPPLCNLYVGSINVEANKIFLAVICFSATH
ncbi:MAG TPA: hypothetical protein DCQ93_09420 [Bacteroidetes bacterium]|nr:hypothetical protein [Bacteroidota bacterium]